MGRHGGATQPAGGKVGELKWFWRVRFAPDGRWAARGEFNGAEDAKTKDGVGLQVFISGCAADDEFRTMLLAERSWETIRDGQVAACKEFDRIGAELGVKEKT